MKYDYVTLYQKNADFYNAHPTAKRVLQLGNIFLTGLFFVAYAVLWLCVLFFKEYTLPLLATILFVPLLGLFLVTVFRMMIDRPRPYHADGANITPVLEKKKETKKSFPSRHLTCAGVISMTVFSLYPAAGICLLVASVLLGYVRFAAGFHYPSDLFFGEALGVLVGCLAFVL